MNKSESPGLKKKHSGPPANESSYLLQNARFSFQNKFNKLRQSSSSESKETSKINTSIPMRPLPALLKETQAVLLVTWLLGQSGRCALQRTLPCNFHQKAFLFTHMESCGPSMAQPNDRDEERGESASDITERN